MLFVPQNGVYSRPLNQRHNRSVLLCKNAWPGQVHSRWIYFRFGPTGCKSKFVHTISFSCHALHQQLHWSDYSNRAYITALQHLHALQNPSNKLINALGLCNFDSARTDEICTALGPGVIVSNQIQVLPPACYYQITVHLCLPPPVLSDRYSSPACHGRYMPEA